MKILQSAVLAVVAACVTGAASAATVLQTQGKTAFGHPNWSSTVSYSLSGETMKTRAGLIRLQDTDGAAFLAWAIDPFHAVNTSDDYKATDTLSTAAKANIDRLYSSAFASVSNATDAAGFQLALWEIVTDSDTGLDLQSGDFSIRGKAAKYQKAATYLDGLADAETGRWNISYFSANSSGANLVSATPVPVPAALGMLGLALAGLYGASRRKS
ncbi:PEP-CTERM sorting domain-containing protein [Actibacterium ureilyticum]|uniref:PEP-CTERM sorting domain-containing protein n=1 Tax=Actibacterium ureilyticum TaxID=1590614 RepID=UPI000BAAEDD8|nr:PEP-CTERM sorting domain-containing protein [Actibacterium ureilyticum]